MATATGSPWLPDLAEAAPRHEMVVGRSTEPDWAALPPRPGVVVFEGDGGRTILIATSADARALARRRLGDADIDAAPRRFTADVRAITTRVVAIEAGSSLAADAIYLSQARERMPETHRVVSERWRAWFLHVDPAAAHPQWTKTNLFGLVAPRSASTMRGGSTPGLPSGLVIGPIADKDTAGRLIEGIIDAFDLCRYHNLLVQAPCAVACAYKEMGRCPAPCDGTETMVDYRARVRGAADHLTGDRGSLLESLRAQMSAVAESHDFERAAALKQRVTRLESLNRPAFMHLANLTSWRLLLVLPSGTPGSVQCVLLAGATLGDLGLLQLGVDSEASAGTIARAALTASEVAPAVVPTLDQIDTIAVVTRWLHAPAARRWGEAIGLSFDSEVPILTETILATAKRVAKPRRAAGPPLGVEERELEVLADSPQPQSASAEADPGTPNATGT